jgi:3-keto-disaccharide hydrolase
MARLFATTVFAAGLCAALATVPAPAADDTKSDSTGFVQLFNGRNLSGWKTHPGDTETKWEVKDGAIVGTGKAGHLYSERDDYENFVYRMEAKINDHGNSGQYFRAKFAKGFPPGYEAQINSTHRDPIKTGSLYPGFNRRLTDAQKAKIIVTDMLVKPDEWFTQEVTADGNHIIIKVDGKQTVDFVDENNTYTKGHFAIQQHDPGTVITVRKVEVKELPSRKGKG